MDITCITPTLDGREDFLELCKRYVGRFTLQPKDHIIVKSNDMHDNLLSALNQVKTPLVAIIEDDDWYGREYLEDMVDKLVFSKRWMLGYDPTVYYHIVKREHTTLAHPYRASLFTTVGYVNALLVPLKEILTDPSKPLIDMALWTGRKVSSVTTIGKHALGIKHNFGRCEARGHTMPHQRKDPEMEYLRDYIGGDAAFYVKLIEDRNAAILDSS